MPIERYVNERYKTNPTPAQRANMEAEVFGLVEYFTEKARMARALNHGRDTDVRELTDQLAALQVAIGATERDHQRMGEPTTTDPKTGKPVKVDWLTRDFPDFAKFKAKREKLMLQRFPGFDMESLESFTRRERADRWRRVNAVYFAGDTRAPTVIRKEAQAARKAAEAEVLRITKANVHSSDAKIRAARFLDKLAERGKPDINGLLAGYSFDKGGEFRANVNPEAEWSKEILFTESFEQVPAPNFIGLVVWADLGFWKRRFNELIDLEANDDDAIRESERPALLAAARADLLDAQRKEEAACKLCEADGTIIGRPAEWPPSVMLEVERIPAPEKPACELTDADFEDA